MARRDTLSTPLEHDLMWEDLIGRDFPIQTRQAGNRPWVSHEAHCTLLPSVLLFDGTGPLFPSPRCLVADTAERVLEFTFSFYPWILLPTTFC